MDVKMIMPAPPGGSRPNLKIITCGLPRSGTTSLVKAFDILGVGPTYHGATLLKFPGMARFWLRALSAKYEGGRELSKKEWHSVIQGFGATVDAPACYFADDLATQYPDAKIIVNYREFDGWYKSCIGTIFVESSNSWLSDYFVPQLWSLKKQRKKFDEFFGFTAALQLPEPEREQCMRQIHKTYYEKMRQVLPKDRTMEWSVNDGWEPLCKHLDIPIPDVPFPHQNKTADFWKGGRYLDLLTKKLAWDNAKLTLVFSVAAIVLYNYVL